MKPRMEYWKAAPGAFKAMSSVETYLRDSAIDKPLLHTVRGAGYVIRAEVSNSP